jgi:hypothetical protein
VTYRGREAVAIRSNGLFAFYFMKTEPENNPLRDINNARNLPAWKEGRLAEIERAKEMSGLKRENAKLRKVAQHCRLFIGDRKGYHDSEAKERKSIIAELDDILSNAEVTHTANKEEKL